MALDLSELKFSVNTEELDRAGRTISELVVNISKLDKAAKDAARTEATLAKAAKDNASANLDSAKAQQINAKAVESTEKAQKSAAQAVERSTSILERQKDILEFQTQGFSKGQSSILAYGKSAGLAAADIAELGKVLETQRKLMGGDPFDKSLSGLKSLQNQYTELKESIRQYAADSDLSSKQTRELARDKERLIEKMKVEGASFSDIRKAVRAHNDEYVSLATSYNKTISAEDAVIRGRKEAVNATNYLIQADQKMAASMNISNASLDKAGTDSLVKYESALRKSGLAQDVITQKLATYKTQLSQVAMAEEKRRGQHLARALTPQASDIVVSLWSGQSPMTVLLQQGSQINDLFQLSGVAAQDFSKTVRTALASMVPAMLTVAKGISGVIASYFVDAGKAITSFISNAVGITAVMDVAKRAIVSGGEENFKYIASLEKLGKGLSIVAATGIAALIAAVIALGIEYKKIVQTEDDLSKALATSGGAIGLSKDQAVAYAEGMKSIGVGTLQAIGAISEFARVGKVGKDGLDLIIKSAIDLEKYAGVSIAETAKQYAKLQDEPTKALTDIAEKTGLVSIATLDYVSSLEQQGDKTKAAEAATKSYTVATIAMAEELKSNLSPIESIWDSIRFAIGKVKQEIYDLTTSNATIGVMKTVWETIAVVISEVWFTLKGVGKEIGGIAAQIAAVFSGAGGLRRAFGIGGIGDQMSDDADKARTAQDKLIDSILNRGEVEKKNFSDLKEQNSQRAAWNKDNEKALERQYSKEERLSLKKKQLQNDLNAGLIDEVKYNQALAGWKRIIMGENQGKSASSSLSIAKDNTAALLTQQYERESSLQQKFLSDQLKVEKTNYDIGYSTRAEYLTKETELMSAALATQKKLSDDAISARTDAYTKEIQDLLAAYNKRVASNKGLKNQSKADAEELDKLRNAIGNASREYENFTDKARDKDAALQSSITAKEVENFKVLLDQVKKNREAIAEYTKANQLRIDQRKEDMVTQDALRWATPEQAVVIKAVAEETKYYNAQLANFNKTALQSKEIMNDTIDRTGVMSPASQLAIKAYNDAMDNTNQVIADARVAKEQAATDAIINYYRDEFKTLTSAITDSIVTALFDGGQDGVKKLRDLLVSTLRKKVTIVVDAVVNTIVGNVVGSALSVGSGSTSGMNSTANLAGLGASFGSGAASWFTNGISGTLDLMTTATESLATDLSFAAGAIGTVVAGLTILDNLGVFGSKFTSAENSGRARIDYSSSGIGGTVYSTTGTAEQSATAAKSVDSLAQSYFKTAAALGIQAMKATFEVGSNTGREGVNPQTVLGVNIGKSSYSSGEISSTDSASLSLAASRAILIALQASEMPSYLTGIFNGIAASTATQDQITSALNSATALKGFHDQLKAMPWESLRDSSYATTKVLIEASGGLDTLASNLGTFYDKFYTDTEKTNIQTANLTKSFADLGIIMPAIDDNTRKWYKSTVEYWISQDQSIASNAKTTASLLSLASSVDTAATSAKSLSDAADALAKTNQGWQDKIDVLTGTKTDAQVQMQQDLASATDDTTKILIQQYYAQQGLKVASDAAVEVLTKSSTDAKTATDKALSAVEKIISAQKEALQTTINVAQEQVTAIKSVFDALSTAVTDLYNNAIPDSTAASGNAFITQALSTAQKTGYLPDSEQLQKAITAAKGGLSADSYQSVYEQQRATLALAGKLSQLKDISSNQLTSAEDNLSVAKSQLNALDAQLTAAKTQVDLLRGIDDSILSLSDALTGLKHAAGVEAANPTTVDVAKVVASATSQTAKYTANVKQSILEQGFTASTSAISGYTDTYTKVLTGLGLTESQANQYADMMKESAKADARTVRSKKIHDYAYALDWTTQAASESSGRTLYEEAKKYGVTEQEIADAIGKSYADVVSFYDSIGIPKFESGTNYIPNDGLAYLHKGEAVVPVAYNGPYTSQNENTQRLESLVEALTAEVVILKGVVEAGNKSTTQLADQFDRVSAGGNALLTETVV